MLFNSLIYIKIKIESLVCFIDKIAYHSELFCLVNRMSKDELLPQFFHLKGLCRRYFKLLSVYIFECSIHNGTLESLA